MVNALTRKTGLTLGPIILETLVKHYFERISKDHDAGHSTELRKEELLYDEAFNIIKSFMEAATKHTVEELQAFSNTRTPSPPWVHTVRLLVPMSCCDEAASHLIKVLGGEQTTKRVVGGTKWWQVRGIKGVDAEWMVAKKDWQEANRKQKGRASMDNSSVDGRTSQEASGDYQVEMDQLKCILYAHGGGYYFGSFDQERYSIQRLARKINGRAFAVNYRLAPQYPFPCAIQDLLAAYLYLIHPPTGAQHAPVAPSNIIFAGDSAGGGLCIATLQVVRDAGLPLPGGAVLISPWCDLTHSFPSIHLNTSTDIIPPYGLSFHKPSTLWPPPPDELTVQVRHSLRQRIREAIRPSTHDGNLEIPHSDSRVHPGGLPPRPTTPDYSVSVPSSGQTLYLGGAGSVPLVTDGVRSQRVSMMTPTGETIAINEQVHMYAPNYLLTHPLVSSVVSYLGGLPPLLIIASDKEVLRDEVIYLAHKAAYIDKYPIKPESRALYPPLEGIEQRHKPTKVHLQVYDDCAHTLPVLFAFTTPGKYCFRAMSTFIRYATGMLPKPSVEIPLVPEADFTTSPMSTQANLMNPTANDTPSRVSRSDWPQVPTSKSDSSVPALCSNDEHDAESSQKTDSSKPSVEDAVSVKLGKRKSFRRAISVRVAHARGLLRRHYSTSAATASSSSTTPHGRESSRSSDVAGPRFHQHKESDERPEHRHTGEASVYDRGLDAMIRERISTRGVIRALEPEGELTAFRLPPELIGEISELAVRRYIDGTARFGKKFGKTAKAIEKARRRNLEQASQDTLRKMAQLQTFFNGESKTGQGSESRMGTRAEAQVGEGGSAKAARADTKQGVRDGLASSGSWPWAWALDEDEHPPPSSIVSRRDTEEARQLARIADQAVLMDESAVSANNLWSLIVNFLTVTPDRDAHRWHRAHEDKDHGDESGARDGRGQESGPSHEEVGSAAREPCTPDGAETDRSPPEKAEKVSRRERIVSRFARLVAENRKARQGASLSRAARGQ